MSQKGRKVPPPPPIDHAANLRDRQLGKKATSA